MPDAASILELRTSVKQWEREFEATQGRKPTSSDARANTSIWALYQQYRAEKKSSTKPSDQPSRNGKQKHKQVQEKAELTNSSLSTPRKKTKPKDGSSASATEDDEDDEEADATPLTKKVTEVFPTPQFRGKVLGLFDVQLNILQTPRKESKDGIEQQMPSMSPSSPCPHTPSRNEHVETPQSKRTPEYFQHRVNLFPSAGPLFRPDSENAELGESPLIKRKTSRKKPVSALIREAEEITAGTKSRSSSILEDHSASSGSEEEENVELPPLNISTEPSVLDTVPLVNDVGSGRKKAPKRQTKRVIMRPIDHNGELSSAKPTENFVRLKINNKNKRPMRRR